MGEYLQVEDLLRMKLSAFAQAEPLYDELVAWLPSWKDGSGAPGWRLPALEERTSLRSSGRQ